MKRILLVSLSMLLSIGVSAQKYLNEAFKPVGDTLTVLARERFNVKAEIKFWKLMKRDGKLDIYFDAGIGDYPWRKQDMDWLRAKLREFWPDGAKMPMGTLFCRSIKLPELETPGIGNDGKPREYMYSYTSHKTDGPFIEELGADHPQKGLYRRGIALWQSHGLYFDAGTGLWSWQRTPLFRTVEDLYTQSYVLPFLIPMLENAGAYVVVPRERSVQLNEIICDNDNASEDSYPFTASGWGDAFPEGLEPRMHGRYSEKGKWSSAGTGFADAKTVYTGKDNPFLLGTARQAATKGGKAEIRWTPVFPKRGVYAVYISYKSLPGSTKSAHYTVHHMGGDTQFAVDQTKGGGTWIYLGTFEFEAGSEGYVSLDNMTPKGHTGGQTVTADAVRFGGGIGKIARGKGPVADSTWTVSGMPSYTEGAIYWMQWAGAPYSLWEKWDDDYTRDYAGRGAWVKWMKDDLGVPVDMSLAFHTDAGIAPGDSIIGTLSIYTLMEKNSRKYKNGQDRMSSRFLADCVQSQIAQDLTLDYDTLWRRRQLWDRSYSECRTTDVPGMLLELLSHQNYPDMKYGQDPLFRFDVCRAIYKGMLKFMSSYYGTSYAVQPLPVKDFAAVLAPGDSVMLSWKATEDPHEPTAAPAGYRVYTRVDGGGWDDGRKVRGTSVSLRVPEDHIHSYKIVAYNDGGCSFPSEILSVGKPSMSKGKVLVVNNFTRVSGPSFFDTPSYAGFDDNFDSGVPWGKDISFIGEDYDHRRDAVYAGNNAPGFGASDYYFAGRTYMGNTFDYPYSHGKALMELGYSFCSCSSSYLSNVGRAEDYFAIDLICGKQVSTITGTGKNGIRFKVFPEELRNELRSASGRGVNLLVSGADIGTEGWDKVYPIKDEDFAGYQTAVQSFDRNVLGFKWVTGRPTRNGVIVPMRGGKPFEIWNTKNEESYCVENPDGIRPENNRGRTMFKYPGSNVGAGVFYQGDGYRAVSYGFPLETVKDPEVMKDLMGEALRFFKE